MNFTLLTDWGQMDIQDLTVILVEPSVTHLKRFLEKILAEN